MAHVFTASVEKGKKKGNEKVEGEEGKDMARGRGRRGGERIGGRGKGKRKEKGNGKRRRLAPSSNGEVRPDIPTCD